VREDAMSAADNRAVVDRFYQVINEHLMDRLPEVVAEDFVEETPPAGQDQGLDGLRRWFETVRAAYPDGRLDVQETFVEGDRVAVRAFMQGTNQGPLLGIEPTGKHVRVETWNVLHLRDGKIQRTRFLMDTGALLQQLGVYPPSTGTDSSADEHTRTVMQGYLDALLARGDYARFFSEDVLWTTMETGEQVRGRQAAADYIHAVHTQAFDAHPELKSFAVTGTNALLEVEFIGTHTRTFADIPPTGAQVRVPYVMAYDVGEDGIRALRFYMSSSSLIAQLRQAVPAQSTSRETTTA
jgi:steroid delta-isomerase-like uncharacterized protein